MKRSIIVGMGAALLFIITMTVAFALTRSTQRIIALGEMPTSINIKIDTRTNEFVIQDDLNIYDLLDLLREALYKDGGLLYSYNLESVNINAIRKKYSDFQTYSIDFDFVLERCSKENNEPCDIDKGEATVELSLKQNIFDESFSILTIPSLELKTRWQSLSDR